MAKKKSTGAAARRETMDAYIAGAGEVVEQPIVKTLELNYMPYAMSVIVSRALPEIDGFKPSHRKLLYTMYQMGLLTGVRTKSANIVGQTMHLNPHGDQAIYDTMVRLSKGYEALLHPFVDSKGNFGKAYSRDMAYAASRYTEAKLAPICAELFRDIDKDTVDFVPNYDNTTTEPTLLPTTFPAVLVNANVGIAVSMASSICPFHLKEVCETTIALMKNPDHDVLSTLLGPDFPGGGFWLYDRAELQRAVDTGRGSFRIRAKYEYDQTANCICVTEIPPTTTVEAIMDKIIELVKAQKIKEIADLRDETDLKGLRLAIDLKRGQDPHRLMQKLFRMTPLQDSFSCNFNILVAGYPRVMGVREILQEWTAFRLSCVKRRIYNDLQQKKKKLHMLEGLQRILLDIDRAIAIVRETEEEQEVVPNLMIGFGIDEAQAEYVAEIKLRHLNREYILKRTAEIEELSNQIAEMEAILASRQKLYAVIIGELQEVIRKYDQPRRTLFLYETEQAEEETPDEIEDYPVHLFLTREGYFKKVTPQSLRMSGEQKLKETDAVAIHLQSTNAASLLFFTDRAQVYKARVSDFADTKVSLLGDFIPAQLGFDPDEHILTMAVTADYQGHMVFCFENGKAARVPLSAYQTKTNRRKLANACYGGARAVAAFCVTEPTDLLFTSSAKRRLLVSTAMLPEKATRDSMGVQVITLKKNQYLETVEVCAADRLANPHRYRPKALPAAGAVLRPEDEGEQLQLS